MTTESMTEEFQPPLTSIALPIAGSFVFTGAIVSLFCKPPLAPSLSWHQLIGLVLLYFSVTMLAHAIAIWVICKLFREHIKLAIKSFVYGTWIAVACLPLLALLSRERSFWVAMVLPLIAANTVIVLRRYNSEVDDRSRSFLGTKEKPALFHNQEVSPTSEILIPAALTSVAFQIGVAAIFAKRDWMAGILFAGCSVFPVWSFPRGTCSRAGGKKTFSSMQSFVVSLFVLFMMGVALTPFARSGRFSGGLKSLLQLRQTEALPVKAASHSGSAFTAVILLPPPKPHHKIVLPVPTSDQQLISLHAKPVEILFDGPYWYYKQPDNQPKSDAKVVHGDPLKANIRSNDWSPLLMEAHQVLLEPIKMNCCSAIRVDLVNADDRPGAISIQILLKNKTFNESSAVSLGSKVLPSSKISSIPFNRSPVDESLNYPLPSIYRDKQFNQITVLVKPARERALAGARVAIKKFVLIP